MEYMHDSDLPILQVSDDDLPSLSPSLLTMSAAGLRKEFSDDTSSEEERGKGKMSGHGKGKTGGAPKKGGKVKCSGGISTSTTDDGNRVDRAVESGSRKRPFADEEPVAGCSKAYVNPASSFSMPVSAFGKSYYMCCKMRDWGEYLQGSSDNSGNGGLRCGEIFHEAGANGSFIDKSNSAEKRTGFDDDDDDDDDNDDDDEEEEGDIRPPPRKSRYANDALKSPAEENDCFNEKWDRYLDGRHGDDHSVFGEYFNHVHLGKPLLPSCFYPKGRDAYSFLLKHRPIPVTPLKANQTREGLKEEVLIFSEGGQTEKNYLAVPCLVNMLGGDLFLPEHYHSYTDTVRLMSKVICFREGCLYSRYDSKKTLDVTNEDGLKNFCLYEDDSDKAVSLFLQKVTAALMLHVDVDTKTQGGFPLIAVGRKFLQRFNFLQWIEVSVRTPPITKVLTLNDPSPSKNVVLEVENRTPFGQGHVFL